VPGRGRALAERVRGEIAAVARRYAGRPKRRVLFTVDGRSGHVVGPDNFVHELITAVGGINVAADADRPWPVYSLEAAIRRAPEVVLDSSGSYREGAEPDAERSFVAGLRAAGGEGGCRIVAVDQRLVTLPGPRLGEAAARLARAIHEAP
jgi:ABC-type hemin transport system substrate-binding protein